MMITAEDTAVELHADQEHSGIRFAVVVLLVAAFVLAFAILSTVLNGLPAGVIGGFAFPVSCAIALIFALALAGVVEQLLKRRWHSGRSVILGGPGIEVIIADEKSLTLEWEKRLAATKWYFTLKGYPRGGRERRVPSSWLCLACQLQQDEHRLVVFGYLPPDKADQLLENGEFHLIQPADLYDRGPFRRRLSSPDRPKLPTSILTGKDGQYWLAERRRWSDGLELTAADFAAFVETVDGHLEE
jgi:hypothetical protein